MREQDFLPIDKIREAKFKGSPTIQTFKKKFLINYFELKFVGQACTKTGISRVTYWNWKNTDPEFKALAEEVLETQIDIAEHKLMRNILEGKETSLIFFLKTKAKHRGYNQDPPPKETEEKFDEQLLLETPTQDLIKLLK